MRELKDTTEKTYKVELTHRELALIAALSYRAEAPSYLGEKLFNNYSLRAIARFDNSLYNDICKIWPEIGKEIREILGS